MVSSCVPSPGRQIIASATCAMAAEESTVESRHSPRWCNRQPRTGRLVGMDGRTAGAPSRRCRRTQQHGHPLHRTTAAFAATRSWILLVGWLQILQLLLLHPCSASYTVALEPDEIQCFYVLVPADRAATLRLVCFDTACNM